MIARDRLPSTEAQGTEFFSVFFFCWPLHGGEGYQKFKNAHIRAPRIPYEPIIGFPGQTTSKPAGCDSQFVTV